MDMMAKTLARSKEDCDSPLPREIGLLEKLPEEERAENLQKEISDLRESVGTIRETTDGLKKAGAEMKEKADSLKKDVTKDVFECLRREVSMTASEMVELSASVKELSEKNERDLLRREGAVGRHRLRQKDTPCGGKVVGSLKDAAPPSSFCRFSPASWAFLSEGPCGL